MPEHLIAGGIDLENQIHAGVRNHARRRAARNLRALGASEAANERRERGGGWDFPIVRVEGKSLRGGGKKSGETAPNGFLHFKSALREDLEGRECANYFSISFVSSALERFRNSTMRSATSGWRAISARSATCAHTAFVSSPSGAFSIQ